MQNLFHYGIVFAAVGGVAGAFWAGLKERSNPLQAAAETLLAAIFAAAAAEQYLPPDKAWVSAGAGVFVGLLTGHALKVVNALAPATLEKVFKNLSERLTGK